MPHLTLNDPRNLQPAARVRPNLDALAEYQIVGGFVYCPWMIRAESFTLDGRIRFGYDNTADANRPDLVRFSPVAGRFGAMAGRHTVDTFSRVHNFYTGSPSSRSFTFLSRVRVNVAPTVPGVVLRTNAVGSGTTIPLWRNGTNFDMRVFGTDYTAAGTWNLGQWYDVDIVGTSSDCVLRVDGAVVINGAVAASGTLEDNCGFGAVAGGGSATDDLDFQYVLWSRIPLSDGQRLSLRLNPWQLFDPDPVHIYWTAAGGGNTSFEPPSGSATLVGYAPTLATPTSITPSVGLLSILGYAPTATQNSIFTPSTAGLDIAGYAPGLVRGTLLIPGVGELVLSGYAPSTAAAGALTPSTGTLTLTGYQPGVAQQTFIVPGVGTLTVSGATPSVAGAGTLIPSEATLTLVGYQPLVTQQSFLVPGVGSITIQGHQPLVEQQVYRIPGVGAATFLGYAPSVAQGSVIVPGSGSVIADGRAPSILADSGSLALTPGAGSLGFIGYAPSVLTAIFVDGNGRVFYLPAQAVEWVLAGRSKKWILR